MKKIAIILILFVPGLILQAENIEPSRTNLHGTITDINGEPVIGVSVYIPELKTGGITDTFGKYRIENLPLRKVQIQITSVGYQMKVETVNLLLNNIMDFVLDESVTEIKEVAVTGQAVSSEISKIPSPVSIITSAKLIQQASTNIIDALSSQPGISQITTGSGISKPVIR